MCVVPRPQQPSTHPLLVKVGEPPSHADDHNAAAPVPAQESCPASCTPPDVPLDGAAQVAACHVLQQPRV